MAFMTATAVLSCVQCSTGDIYIYIPGTSIYYAITMFKFPRMVLKSSKRRRTSSCHTAVYSSTRSEFSGDAWWWWCSPLFNLRHPWGFKWTTSRRRNMYMTWYHIVRDSKSTGNISYAHWQAHSVDSWQLLVLVYGTKLLPVAHDIYWQYILCQCEALHINSINSIPAYDSSPIRYQYH